MGAPPSKGTKADQRLKENNPNAGKKPAKPPMKQQPPQKGKY